MGLKAYVSMVVSLSWNLMLLIALSLMGESLKERKKKKGKVKESFHLITKNDCEKYHHSDDDEWCLGFDKRGTDIYMKYCKVLVEPIVESKDKKKRTKTNKKVVHVERELK